MVAFSFTVPLTRIAAESGTMSPLFLGVGRAAVASVLAGLILIFVGRQRRGTTAALRIPSRTQCLRLLLVAGGIVLGFPLLTSFALAHTSASHGAVVIALLPAATAAAAVFRTREATGLRFWLMAGASAVVAVVFALVHGDGFGELGAADALLFAAVVAAAIGYAEGGVLARELGSWQTVSWALVLSAPITVGLTLASAAAAPPHGTMIEWAAFGYLAVVSMFLGFFAWYRGLAVGPMAQVSQVQLSQPVMSLVWATVLLGEKLEWETVVCGVAVIGCAALTVRTRLRS